MKRLRLENTAVHLGFQIAPMIDVVFVIMLFFMVMAGALKVERELNTQLPGSAETQEATDMVDELVVHIAETGEISLNDEPMDAAASREMPALKAALVRLKKASDEAKSPTLVTLVSEPGAMYSRTVDALDALAFAGISNVTFTIAEDE